MDALLAIMLLLLVLFRASECGPIGGYSAPRPGYGGHLPWYGVGRLMMALEDVKLEAWDGRSSGYSNFFLL